MISSDEGIMDIFFDIRRYYQFKSRTFIHFYLYSYTEYIRELLHSKAKSGMDIVLKSKNTASTFTNYITSLEFLHGPQE